MKKLFLAATICTLVSAFPAYGAGVSFEHARALMQERADMLKMSQADIEQRQQQVKESRSLSGPKISLNAQQVEGRKDINMSFDNSPGRCRIRFNRPSIASRRHWSSRSK